MGQVFTLDAVRNGRIPQLESFSAIKDMLRREMEDEPAIVDGLLFGSVSRGDYTRRSDLDCVVVYDHALQHQAFSFMRRMHVAAARLYVPLNLVPCDTLIAKTRLHHVGPSFKRHLRESAWGDGILKGDPLESIGSSITPDEELESFLRMKMYGLQETWAESSLFSEEDMAAFLKKLLEAPLHVARRLLASRQKLDGDSKSAVQKSYRQHMSEFLADGLDELIALDAHYGDELSRCIDTKDFAAYEVVLKLIYDRAGHVLKFIRNNICIVNPPRRQQIDHIQKTVSSYYRVSQLDMISDRRSIEIARPRQVAMWLCKRLTSRSLPEIGRMFGNRDHSTVIHAVRRINELRAQPGNNIESDLDQLLHILAE